MWPLTLGLDTPQLMSLVMKMTVMWTTPVMTAMKVVSVSQLTHRSHIPRRKASLQKRKEMIKYALQNSDPSSSKWCTLLFWLKSESVDAYFDAHEGAAVTSDRTLAKLAMPKMDQETLTNLLEGREEGLLSKRMVLSNELRMHFDKWMYLLWWGFSSWGITLGSIHFK